MECEECTETVIVVQFVMLVFKEYYYFSSMLIMVTMVKTKQCKDIIREPSKIKVAQAKKRRKQTVLQTPAAARHR